MKQLLIVTNTTLNSGASKPSDLSTLAKGAIGFFHLDNYNSWLSSSSPATKNFGIALGYAPDANAFVIPEVDFSSLTVEKATPSNAVAFTAKMTVSTVEVGEEYTIIVAKKGVVSHERNTWTATTLAKTGSTATTIAADLVKQFNASTETSGIKAENAAGVITFTAAKAGDDFTVTGADGLLGVKPTNVTNGVPAILDAAYVKDLASRCAAGKGFNYTAEDAHEMYPGYPEHVLDGKYVLFTLRFKVGRSGAKQRDEQVYQLVHIAVAESATSVISAIESILGVGSTAKTPSVEDGD